MTLPRKPTIGDKIRIRLGPHPPEDTTLLGAVLRPEGTVYKAVADDETPFWVTEEDITHILPREYEPGEEIWVRGEVTGVVAGNGNVLWNAYGGAHSWHNVWSPNEGLTKTSLESAIDKLATAGELTDEERKALLEKLNV